ncbi:MAG: LrgB family protein [Odoribacter splanchnicus]
MFWAFLESFVGSRIISFMLGPTVVVLGYLFYEQIARLKENAVSIITSVFVGCVTGIVSVITSAILVRIML